MKNTLKGAFTIARYTLADILFLALVEKLDAQLAQLWKWRAVRKDALSLDDGQMHD